MKQLITGSILLLQCFICKAQDTPLSHSTENYVSPVDLLKDTSGQSYVRPLGKTKKQCQDTLKMLYASTLHYDKLWKESMKRLYYDQGESYTSKDSLIEAQRVTAHDEYNDYLVRYHDVYPPKPRDHDYLFEKRKVLVLQIEN